jgi:transcription elongation factor GreA
MTKQQLTKDGFEKLKLELQALNNKAGQLVDRLEEVAQPDESGEDSLATQLKAELEVVNDKIASYEEALANIEIVSGKISKNIITVGSTVKIKVGSSTQKEFTLVSEFESDPTTNKISSQSPLGLALLGKKVGQTFQIDAPVGKVTYKIVSIG